MCADFRVGNKRRRQKGGREHKHTNSSILIRGPPRLPRRPHIAHQANIRNRLILARAIRSEALSGSAPQRLHARRVQVAGTRALVVLRYLRIVRGVGGIHAVDGGADLPADHTIVFIAIISTALILHFIPTRRRRQRTPPFPPAPTPPAPAPRTSRRRTSRRPYCRRPGWGSSRS